jgi:hypothetical protein
MNSVLELNSSPSQSRAVMEKEDDFDEYESSSGRNEKVMQELEESFNRSKSPSLPKINQESDEDEDDAMSYFSKLVDM